MRTRFFACALLVIVSAAPGTGTALAAGVLAPLQAPPGPCPNSLMPPPPVDTSEVPPPGAPVPGPLPVPDKAVGGDRLGGCGVLTPNGAAPPPPEVTASSWVVADLNTGDVVAAKDPHARHRPASTIKVLTALVAVRELRMDDTVVATQADADQEGSRVGLLPGVTYTVRDVLTGLLLQSGNDAAHALAMKVGGIDAMVGKMNELAVRLGAHDTRAATPSGLDGPGMSTSAYDLALIFREAMRRPEFATAAATKNITLPGPPGQPPMQVGSDNAVVLSYPGALGGKTGFTDDARHTFVAAAERGGRKLVAVLLRGENQPIRLSGQTTRLLDYGFGLGAVEPLGKLVEEPKPSLADGSPKPQAASPDSPAPGPASSGMFGTVGAPVALLAVAGGAVVAVVAVVGARQRRAKLARRDDASRPSDTT